MFGFQTFACLHDIPVVRSSTNKLQDVYVKAKDKSVLIRFPCNLAETIADKSLKIAFTIANPLVKPLRGPVRVIDDFAVEKLRQIEAKYPAINTSTENFMNTLTEKTEPVRNVINTVKDTTTTTIQHGKETVSNVADSVYTFCETHVPGKTSSVDPYDFGRRTTLLWERIRSTISLLITNFLIWFRLLIVSFLIKIKQTNDKILNQIQKQPILFILLQQLFIYIGIILKYIIKYIQPNNYTEKKQQNRVVQQKQFISRQTLKPGALDTKNTTVINRNGIKQQQENDSSDKLHSKVNSTDAELLYSRLSADIIPNLDNQESLTEDQQYLQTKIIDADFERQDYLEDEDFD